MPFGGVKGSGMGRFGGKAGIDEFTELRWITVQTHAAALSRSSARGAARCYASRPTHRSVPLEKRNATQTDLVGPGCGTGGRACAQPQQPPAPPAASAPEVTLTRLDCGTSAAARRRGALLRRVLAPGPGAAADVQLLPDQARRRVHGVGHRPFAERGRGGAEGEPGRPARTAAGEARADQVRGHQPLPPRPHRPGGLVSRHHAADRQRRLGRAHQPQAAGQRTDGAVRPLHLGRRQGRAGAARQRRVQRPHRGDAGHAGPHAGTPQPDGEPAREGHRADQRRPDALSRKLRQRRRAAVQHQPLGDTGFAGALEEDRGQHAGHGDHPARRARRGQAAGVSGAAR